MGIIHALDPTTIQQIAAGEVIDRPASIVKELVENSLDAGATAVTIDIENGGLSRIQIIDNGHGIHPEDLPLAPRPHTTSKITVVDDIFHITTRGFRGEALASIAHVGSLTITSRHRDLDIGAQLSATIAGISEPKPMAHPIGTTMLITRLFDDAPVRRKFLKSPATEFGYIYEIVSHFSLIFPEITFVLRHNGKESLNTRGTKDLAERVALLLGDKDAAQLIPVSYEMLDIGVSGVVGNPGITYANRRWQLFGINGRPVKSQILYKATMDAFADVLPARRFPLAILSLTLPPETIDVNVHPQKLEVKFQKTQHIYEAVRRAITGSFHRQEATLADAAAGLQSLPTPSALANESRRFAATDAGLDYRAPVQSPASAPTWASFEASGRLWETTIPTPTAPLWDRVPSPVASPVATREVETAVLPLPRATDVSVPTAFLQILNTYIVVPTPSGMWIMDQHAVHERILYEQLKQNADLALSQPLLIPHPVYMTQKAMFCFQEVSRLLHDLGFEVEVFGRDQVVIRSIPQWALSMPLTPFFEAMMEALEEASAQDAALAQQKEPLQMRACKAAIKAGKTLHEAEIKALVTDFLDSPSNYTCPHGRPLAKFFDKQAFEKWFMR